MSEALTFRRGMTQRTIAAGQDVLAGRRRGLRAMLPFAGPAVIASIAYMDPGNFATNIQGGAQFGYLLLWVVVLANLVAMLFQALSAKVGIVTGQSLAGLCRRHFPRPVVLAMWVVSEIAAMATDLAESLGAAIGLSLLFGVPLLAGLLVTFVVTYAILLLQGSGFRPIELVITAFVGAIGVCYLIELIVAPPDWHAFAFHSVVPQLAGPGSVTLAVGIIGATVMPHAIYLHSSLMQHRVPAANAAERRRILRYSNREVLLALSVMSLPLLVRSARTAFEEVNPRLEQIARTLGAGGWRVFFTITVPLAARGIVGGMLLAFARALGEFGATIMVAGNIQGKTQTISLAIFENVQIGDDAHAYHLLGVSVVLAFIAVWSSEFFLRRKKTT